MNQRFSINGAPKEADFAVKIGGAQHPPIRGAS